jgi:hypothetical protein
MLDAYVPAPGQPLLIPSAEPLEFRGTEHFQVQRKLGMGGMGVVYQAYDLERSTVVALKVLRRVDAKSLALFKKEFRAVAEVVHPNLVRLGELYCEDGQWFFTMELVAGQDILSYVRRDASGCDEARLRHVLPQLAAGVSALHRAKLVHRDLKPSNILVTPEHRVVVLDFGLVANIREGTEDETGTYGTVTYMAPEQAAAKPVGPAADWYSVGVVLYQALTGTAPFTGSPIEVLMAKAKEVAPAPRDLDRGLPEDLSDICAWLLMADPRARPTGEVLLGKLGVALPSASFGPSFGSGDAPFVTHPPFVGRHRELAFVDDAYRHSATQAVTVLVHGASGLGKSALVKEFLHRLKEKTPSLMVLEGRCYERESVPYKAFDGIVEALSRRLAKLDPVDSALLLPRDVPILARLFPAVRRIPAVARATPLSVLDPHEQRTRAFRALRDLLARLCETHRIVLAIDDFQWADADSATLLGELLYPGHAPPLFVLITVRSPASTNVEAIHLLGDVRHLELPSLSSEESQELATLLLGHVAQGESHAATLAREAAGHPLYLQELARYVGEAGALSPRAVLLDEALWARVVQLEAPARTLLELLAVAGSPLPQDTAAQAASMDLMELSRWAALLRTAQLVRGSGTQKSDVVEPYHDRVREAVLAHLPDDVSRRHHTRLAEVLEAKGAGDVDPQALVRHLVAMGAPLRAAALAQRAAALAAHALAFDQAARLYRTALELGPCDPAEVRAIREELGDALANAGRGGEAAEAYLLAAQGAEDALAQDLKRRAAHQLLLAGHIDEGLAATRTALAAVGLRMPETRLATFLSLLWARTTLRLRGIRYRARDESQVPVAVLRRIDTCWSTSLGMAFLNPVRGSAFQTQHMLLALRSGEPYRIARSLAAEAAYTVTAGPHMRRRADALAAKAEALAQELGHPHALGFCGVAAGLRAMALGEFRECRVHVDRAEALLRERCTGVTWEIDTAHDLAVTSLVYLGDMAELRRRVPRYLRDAEEHGDLYAATNSCVGDSTMAWLAADDPEGGRKEAQRGLERYSQEAEIIQGYAAMLSHVQLDLYEGKGQEALEKCAVHFPRLRRALLLYVQIVRVAATNLRTSAALLAGLQSKGQAQTRLLAAAETDARRLAKENVPWAVALGTLHRAGVLAARGHEVPAIETYADAARHLSAADLALHSAAARWRRGQLVGGDEGHALVSEARTWMEAHGVNNPSRMAGLLAPTASS